MHARRSFATSATVLRRRAAAGKGRSSLGSDRTPAEGPRSAEAADKAEARAAACFDSTANQPKLRSGLRAYARAPVRYCWGGMMRRHATMARPASAITLTCSMPRATLPSVMKQILFLASLLSIASAFSVAAEPVNDLPGLSRFKLANGLEVYAYRDAGPLARIQIVFRTGAVSQGPENAGLFRLYEHMLFGGPAAHPGSAKVKAALASIGATGWGGGTEAERVDFWVALPSAEAAGAL